VSEEKPNGKKHGTHDKPRKDFSFVDITALDFSETDEIINDCLLISCVANAMRGFEVGDNEWQALYSEYSQVNNKADFEAFIKLLLAVCVRDKIVSALSGMSFWFDGIHGFEKKELYPLFDDMLNDIRDELAKRQNEDNQQMRKICKEVKEATKQTDYLSKDEKAPDTKRTYFGEYKVKLDKNRRIVLPKALIGESLSGEEMVVVGVVDHLEIWPLEDWERVTGLSEENIKIITERMNSLLGSSDMPN
jgi:DNA-binding transcriptional regulator/RsmH inhibitor MraZ